MPTINATATAIPAIVPVATVTFGFPPLGVNPSSDYGHSALIDPTLRSKTESGAVLTRARFTAVPKKWSIVYRNLSQANKETIEAFEADTVNYGADAFDWLNSVDGLTYSVRFNGLVSYRIEQGAPAGWKVSFELAEARPNSGV